MSSPNCSCPWDSRINSQPSYPLQSGEAVLWSRNSMKLKLVFIDRSSRWPLYIIALPLKFSAWIRQDRLDYAAVTNRLQTSVPCNKVTIFITILCYIFITCWLVLCSIPPPFKSQHNTKVAPILNVAGCHDSRE